MGGCQNYDPFFGYPNYGDDRGYIGVLWGIMEKKTETTIMGYIGIIGLYGWLSKL